ncbi:Xaa-Pro peptidase family protein [Rubripirellula sp.]|nr:Xaa-Pro peptidase family protein [Rubripirellula sp.]MDB4749536.1 Xaa-Pro peptidase family protein [Rubripirellula sp.]
MSALPCRLQRLASSLEEHEVDAMLVTDEINVRYLSGFTGDSSSLVVTPRETTILSDGRYSAQIAEQCTGIETRIRSSTQLLRDLTSEVLLGAGVKRVAIEADNMTLDEFRFFESGFEGIELVPTTGRVAKLRMIKDEAEIDATRRAVKIAEQVFTEICPTFTRQHTEVAVAHEIEHRMRLLGAEGCSFPPIVAAGPGGALPHYQPQKVAFADHPSLLIDWGAKFDGYASDLTRTLHQEHASDAFKRAYQGVLEAQLAAIELIRPGMPVKEIDAAARDALKRHGSLEAFSHGLGHGTGLQIHESPSMSPISEEILAEGMIITVEPGVYYDGEFGIRIEDDVLVTNSGHEVLSSLPKGLDDCRFIL